MALPAALLAKLAAAAMSNEETRRKAGWIAAAILSPLVVTLALLCSLLSGGAEHNRSAVLLSFRGGDIVGYEVPIAIDHFGHVGIESSIRFCKRMEKYNLAWVEDMVPWIYPKQLARLHHASNIPVCTGEDIYLKEGFEKLMDEDAVSIIHPDPLTCGGILELKKIGDLATERGVAVAIHMAESPIACMAAVHAAAAMQHVLALEFHSSDVPWWDDIVVGLPKPLIQDGFIKVPETPGLGIECLNEKLIAEHICKKCPGVWEATDEWDHEFSNDRIWS